MMMRAQKIQLYLLVFTDFSNKWQKPDDSWEMKQLCGHIGTVRHCQHLQRLNHYIHRQHRQTQSINQTNQSCISRVVQLIKPLQDPLEVGNNLPGINDNVRERGVQQKCIQTLTEGWQRRALIIIQPLYWVDTFKSASNSPISHCIGYLPDFFPGHFQFP